MIENFLVDSITRVSSSRNRFGDIVYGASEVFRCRFREINDLTRSVDGREQLQCDALVHFDSKAGISIGDILVYNGAYYRIDSIVKARRGGSTNIEFIKCGLLRHRQVS